MSKAADLVKQQAELDEGYARLRKVIRLRGDAEITCAVGREWVEQPRGMGTEPVACISLTRAGGSQATVAIPASAVSAVMAWFRDVFGESGGEVSP